MEGSLHVCMSVRTRAWSLLSGEGVVSEMHVFFFLPTEVDTVQDVIGSSWDFS